MEDRGGVVVRLPPSAVLVQYITSDEVIGLQSTPQCIAGQPITTPVTDYRSRDRVSESGGLHKHALLKPRAYGVGHIICFV